MEFQDNNSSIDKLKRGLYSRDSRSKTGGRSHRLKNEFYDAASDWSHEDEESPEKKPVFTISRENRGMTFAAKF